MFRKLTLVGALVLAFAVQAPAAQGAATAGEALIDRFMAVIPDAQRLNRVDRTPNPEELAHLTRLNPGRDGDIGPVLAEHKACESIASNAATESLLRGIARRLDEDKLGRLIQFYEGDDLRNFEALMSRSNGGATPSDADRAELERIMAAYPLMEYHEGFQSAYFTLFEDPTYITALDRCSEAKRAALCATGTSRGRLGRRNGVGAFAARRARIRARRGPSGRGRRRRDRWFRGRPAAPRPGSPASRTAS